MKKDKKYLVWKIKRIEWLGQNWMAQNSFLFETQTKIYHAFVVFGLGFYLSQIRLSQDAVAKKWGWNR